MKHQTCQSALVCIYTWYTRAHSWLFPEIHVCVFLCTEDAFKEHYFKELQSLTKALSFGVYDSFKTYRTYIFQLDRKRPLVVLR